MKTCKLDHDIFEDITIEGVRFAIVEPEIILFNASDDLMCVEVDSWFVEQLTIVSVGPDLNDIPIPQRMLDSPIVNGGKPWIVAIIEAACELAAKRGTWETYDDSADRFDAQYDLERTK